MITTRIRNAMARQQLAVAFVLLAAAATVAACKSYVFIPVDVSYETLSPPYVVRIVNDTGAPFDVRPSSTGTRAGYAAVRVPPGESFKAILQLRRFTVGAGSPVAGAQVIDNPYFEHALPDKAELRVVQADPRSIFIAVQHSSWFEEYTRDDPTPIELGVRLREFSRTPLFPKGPRAGP